MADELRGRFEAFRADSIARTLPPGVAAVRHRVARRLTSRAAALGIASIAVLAATWLPHRGGDQQSSVLTSPTPAASQSAGATPTPSPSASPTVTTSSPTARASRTRSRSCPDLAAMITSADPDTFTFSSQLHETCPLLTRVDLVRATYLGIGPSSISLPKYSSAEVALTRTAPTVTFAPGLRPSGSCYTYLTVTLITDGGDAPASIPNLVSTFGDTEPDSTIRLYFSKHGYTLMDQLWAEPAC